MDKRLSFLKRLLTSDARKVLPQRELSSSFGYGYPDARELLGGQLGEELDSLEWLAGHGYLERSFAEKIHLCPYCSHYALNFQEVCPRCRSADVDIVEMVHHFRCGHVGPESEFRVAVRFVCPKCSRPVRHLGVDYERPSSNYLCGACRHVFVDPPVSCLCLRCGEDFGVARAETRAIHAYSLSEKGAIAASRERLEAEETTPFIDEELAVYDYGFFEQQLGQEVRAARRYEKPLTVLLARPDQLAEYRREQGNEAAARLFRVIVQAAKEALRDCDIPSHAEDGVLATLLPGTSLAGAKQAARRIVARVAELENGARDITLSIGLATLGGEDEDADRLLAIARERLERVQAAGGNGIEGGAE